MVTVSTPSALNPQPSTPNPQPSTLNPQPSTHNPHLVGLQRLPLKAVNHNPLPDLCPFRRLKQLNLSVVLIRRAQHHPAALKPSHLRWLEVGHHAHLAPSAKVRLRIECSAKTDTEVRFLRFLQS
jgi:hypothetical protein